MQDTHDSDQHDTLEDAIDIEIAARPRRLDDFEVGRVLPAPARRMVGPFAFFDHMGPAHLAPGRGMDVRPHPHIGLATVTYLFEGEILHRDSLGSVQPIRPGAINWMTAGRGIVHSERTPGSERAAGPALHGLQLWVALPKSHEEVEPVFAHHPADTIPQVDARGVRMRVLAGSAYGTKSPVTIASPLFYVEVHLDKGARLELPQEYEERALYVISGAVRSGGAVVKPNTMAVFHSGRSLPLEALEPTHLVLIGGDRLESPRFIWWNFVSSSQDRIIQAAHEWKTQQFPLVPGDELERIPLLEEPHFARSQSS